MRVLRKNQPNPAPSPKASKTSKNAKGQRKLIA